MKPAFLQHTLRLFLAVPLLLGACGDADDGQRAVVPAGGETTVVVAQPVDIGGVNELTTAATPIHSAILSYALFLPLVDEQADYQEGPPSFAPRLARSYEFSADRLQLTFQLREDAVWSDGIPVTAEDVRWTWQAQTHPEVAWPNVETKARISDVEVVDPHTVRFHFTEAYATQLQDAVLGLTLPKHAWSRLPFAEWRGNSDWFVENLVVNGPFALESWEPQQRFVLRRNERYFEPGVPKVDRVVFQITPDPNSQLALLRSGQAHLVEWVQPADVAGIETVPGVRIVSHLPRSFYYLGWNVSRPLLAQPEVRQALTMALDRQQMIDTLHHGHATLSSSPFPSDLWARNRELTPWPYDPGAAKELLAKAGWSDSDGDGVLDRDGEAFRFTVLVNAENALRKDIVVMFQEQLKRIGVDMQIQVLGFSALLPLLQSHDFDALIFGLSLDTSLDTSYFFHTRGSEDGYNWGLYSDPEVDRLIEEIAGLLDQAEAKPLFDELQEILHRDLPMTFLYEAPRLSGVRDELQDYRPNSISAFFNIREWRLVEE